MLFFTEETFDKLCPKYKKAVLKLENELCAIDENVNIEDSLKLKDEYWASKAKRNLIIVFSENFLVSPEIWNEWFRLHQSEYLINDWIEEDEAAANLSNQHFFIIDDRASFRRLRKKFFHYRKYKYLRDPLRLYTNDEIKAIEDLRYPYLDLEWQYQFVNEYSSNPISKDTTERYNFMKNLREKILALDENEDKKWFELLLESKNDEFVVHNVEYRLGRNLNNKDLWKLYFDYIKDRDQKKMFELYSKYCRYFLDDKKMKTEYKAAVKNSPEKYHKVTWKNPFKFEKYVPEEVPKPSSHATYDAQSYEMRKPDVKAKFENYSQQTFSLPKTIMAYLIQVQSPLVLHKLHKTCKYFFIIHPNPVCHKFCCSRQLPYNSSISVEFYGQSLNIIHELEKEYTFEHRLIISNSFNIRNLDSYFLSYVFTKIIKCHAKYIHIKNQTLSLNEFIFIVGHGNVECLHLDEVKIVDIDELPPLPIEDILRMTPKILEFSAHDPYTTTESSQILSELTFVNKIQRFSMTSLNYLEPNGFLHFLKRNFKPYFYALLVFKTRNSTFAEFIAKEYRINNNDCKDYHIHIR